MLNEYETVVPFGVRAFADSDDVKMQCFQEDVPEADWDELIQKTVDALKERIQVEDIFATAVVLALESDAGKGVGIQIETRQGPALFVYPYQKADEQWKIEEPTQSTLLVAPRVFA